MRRRRTCSAKRTAKSVARGLKTSSTTRGRTDRAPSDFKDIEPRRQSVPSSVPRRWRERDAKVSEMSPGWIGRCDESVTHDSFIDATRPHAAQNAVNRDAEAVSDFF